MVLESEIVSWEEERVFGPQMMGKKNNGSEKRTHIPVEEPGPDPEPPAPKGPTLIVGSKAIISANMSMIGFGTVLS